MRTNETGLGAMLFQGYRSARFHAARDDSSFLVDKPLSERLLFTQSNLRVLLGQDTAGRLAFVGAPHERDYGIPTCVGHDSFPITAHPGMYYQADVAMWYGRARYLIELEDGRAFDAAPEGADSWYLDHFLPVTRAEQAGLRLTTFSLAPVMEPGAACAIAGAQLPGPSGALFALHIENTSGARAHGRCKLLFEREFVIRSEYDGANRFEADAVQPYHCEWERDLYTLWRPDACASIHLKHARHNEDAGHPELWVELDIAPGASQTVECRVAVAPDKGGIAPALATLFQHGAAEWLDITRAFWARRLGDWTCGIEGEDELAAAYRDMQIRSVLDNFNCLQADALGRLLVHWQGAPSHNIGRFWGIDIEPTAISVLYALPELGPCLLAYIAERNEPRFSEYNDHSTPIRVALLSIAGQYLRLTGDVDCFRFNPRLVRAMRETYVRLMTTKHSERALFPSRYSSDGIVFHRYDLGTNAKVIFALGGYKLVLDALEDPLAREIGPLIEVIRRDIQDTMVGDGPFGQQYTGGTSLGEGRGFYFRDDLWYYDGEDSSSCMMPVYGVNGFDDEAWRNYHRFARSLFSTNFDPEMGALRWFFYGGAVDGTAYISRLGGSVARAEMRAALSDMLERSVDLTGSLYWWPKGVNKRRCIARCSQGQGSWLLQGTEQWLGLRYDALQRELIVRPQGLLSGYRWQGARLGRGLFDIEWREVDGEARLRVVNRNDAPVRVRAGLRPRGSGADGDLAWHELELAPGAESDQHWAQPTEAAESAFAVEPVELERLSEDGIVFGPFGLQLPSAEQDVNAFLLRFALLSGEPLEDVELTLEVPDGFGAMAKTCRVWDTLPREMARTATLQTGYVPALERCVLPFYVALPGGMPAHRVWQSAHPFEYPPGNVDEPHLYAEADASSEHSFHLTLRFTRNGAPQRIDRTMALSVLSTPELDALVHRLMYQNRS